MEKKDCFNPSVPLPVGTIERSAIMQIARRHLSGIIQMQFLDIFFNSFIMRNG